MNNNLTPHYQKANNNLNAEGPHGRLALSIEAFLRALPGKNRSPATIKAYRTDLAFFAVWLIENNVTAVQPAAVTRADIEAYLSELAHQGLTGVTRARKLAAIREYFRFLENHGVISRSPAAGVDAPRREEKARVYLRPIEYQGLLSVAGGNARDFAILQVFLQTGVRVAELVTLRLGDVDFPGKLLTVRGKGMVERQIDLEKHTIEAVKNWLRSRPEGPYDRLFLNYRGEPISERSVRRVTDHENLPER